MTARSNGDVRPAPTPVSPASSIPDFVDNAYDGVAGVRRDAVSAADTAVVLSRLWSRPTADEFQVWLQWRDSADHLFRQVCESDEYAWDELDVPELLAEYERLFIGPGPVPCPPYESYWRQDVSFDMRGSLMGPCTAELRDLYGDLGLETAPATGEMPDFLPIELEAFAYALASTERFETGRVIFAGHLRHWLPRFADAVERASRHHFYADLARVTAAWAAEVEWQILEPVGDAADG